VLVVRHASTLSSREKSIKRKLSRDQSPEETLEARVTPGPFGKIKIVLSNGPGRLPRLYGILF